MAFVNQNEPEANEVAANYLKRDFVKSLLVRVALARERWAEDDEGGLKDLEKILHIKNLVADLLICVYS